MARIEQPGRLSIRSAELERLIDDAPEPVRRYIYELRTRCDPSGDIQELADLREQVAALSLLIEEMVGAANASYEALKSSAEPTAKKELDRV